MPSTSCTVSGAFLVHGPSGITWWVCTSTTNSPLPPSACSHASTSCGGGTVNEPPGPRVVVDATSRSTRGEVRRARRRRAARGQIDRGEHRRDAARRLQEPAPVHARLARRVVGVAQRGARNIEIVPRRRIGHVLAVRGRQHAQRQSEVAVGIVVAPASRHVRITRRSKHHRPVSGRVASRRLTSS